MKFTIDMTKKYELTLAPRNRMEELEQSIYILINTMRGEVPCYREFGINTDYLHKPISVAKQQYAAAVAAAVERFIPGIQVRRITFAENVNSPGNLKPIMEVVMCE